MTACVNRKHTKKVAAVVTASLVGALSLGVAPVAAMATEGIETLAISASAVWDGIEFTWNTEADEFGVRTVESGDQLLLTGAVDAFGAPVSMSDVTVLYVDAVDGNGNAYDGVHYWTSTPEKAGTYHAVVFNGRGDIDNTNSVSGDNATGGVLSLSDLKLSGTKQKSYEFKVEAKSLEGSFAYEGTNVHDTSFKYTGKTKTVGFSDAEGNMLPASFVQTVVTSGGTDVTADWSANNLEDAGTYTAYLTGDGTTYSGTVKVEFTISPIDLKNDVFTVAPIKAGTSAFSTGTLNQATGHVVKVNGEELDSDVVIVKVKGGTGIDAGDKPFVIESNYGGKNRANLDLIVSANSATDDSNFVDDAATGSASAVVVTDVLTGDFFYDGEPIVDGTTVINIETADGESFDPSKLSAYNGSNKVPCSWTAYKDGEGVTDFSEPGEYEVTIEFKVPENLSYAGSAKFTVNVVAKRFAAQPKAFIAVDGKDITTLATGIEYDGEPIEPVIAVKAGSAAVDAADYTVTYKDAEGNEVESIVEPGTYTVSIDFGNAQYWSATTKKFEDVDGIEEELVVSKAVIRSAKADKDVYAYVEGQDVKPVFTAYTEGDLEGLELAIDPSVTGVSYFELKVNDRDGKPAECSSTDVVSATCIDVDADGKPEYELENGTPLKASDLDEEGWYVAQLTAPADDVHFTGQVYSMPFQVSTYAAFADVAADAWYAQVVYQANDLNYMKGIAGTKLFMPEADITRGEIAQVFFNMAGKPDFGYANDGYVPTKFDDVDGRAWYAEPIAWASNSGIVTGYDDTTFGPSDKASREQVAVMLYRYAKAQGKDVAVDDADAALAAYKDGDQVADWAKDAMAWAVENGVFGVDTDELYPTENIQRAAVAAIAVRFQPEALPQA